MGAFRDFLDELKKRQELNVIEEEVDWELQASAICAMSQRTGGPAIQFNKVKDCPGVPLVGSVFCGPGFMEWPQEPRRMQGRMAIALGLEPDTHYDDVLATVRDRIGAPIRAIEVESGPCQEVIIEGDEVNLYKYPVPMLHDKDGGRYLTSHVVLTRDPERAWTNMGTYRLKLAERNRLVQGGIARRTTPSHIEQIVQKSHAKGEPLPFAIVIGAPPEMMMAACLNTPPETDEYALAGGLGLNSIPVVKAKLSDILVPASAEIILEGHIYPGEMDDEGPFGSISFYTEKERNFVYRVECITQREHPIFPFIAEGARPSDTMCLFSLCHAAELMRDLLMTGVPAKSVILPVETRLCLAIVSLPFQPGTGIPGRLGHLVLSRSQFVRIVLVVDADLDSEDYGPMLADRNFKASPDRDWIISKEMSKPLGWTENHDWSGKLGSTLIIDACWKIDRDPTTIPRRTTFEACFPKEVRDRVITTWNEKLKLSPKVWQYKL